MSDQKLLDMWVDYINQTRHGNRQENKMKMWNVCRLLTSCEFFYNGIILVEIQIKRFRPVK